MRSSARLLACYAALGAPSAFAQTADKDGWIDRDSNVEARPHKLVVVEDPPPLPPPPRMPDTDLGSCSFFPEPECPYSIVAELGFGFGQNLSNLPQQTFVARTYLELGILAQAKISSELADLHFGPVFALGVETADITFGWVASPRVRARYFAASTHFVIEHSIGPQFQRFVFHDALETGTRAGLAADLSFGYRGIVGAWGELSALGDVGGNDGTRLQWIAGIRANLIGWGGAIGGITGAFGNSTAIR